MTQHRHALLRLFCAVLLWLGLYASQMTLAVVGSSKAEIAALSVRVPEHARIDASASYVLKTIAGEKTGYLVMFKPGSIADPTKAGRRARQAQGMDEAADTLSTRAAKDELLQRIGVRPRDAIDRYGQLPITYVEVSSADELNRLLSLPEVEGLYENRIHKKHATPNLDLIRFPSVTAYGNLGQGTSVAVLDSGVRYTGTPEIVSAFGPCTSPGVPASCRVVFAQDFTLQDDGQLDPSGHGTNVAAIVAAVAPKANILSLDVFNGESAQDNDIIAAMNWVIDKQRTQPNTYNIVAMNLSLGDAQFTPQPVTTGLYKTVVDTALVYRVATIVAGGNEGSANGLGRPANTLGAISVGAVYSSGDFSADTCYAGGATVDKPVCNSNRASYLTMLAPGKFVTAAGLQFSGTSQAAPHVAGAYAVLRAAFPTESHDAIVARLVSGGVPVTDTRFNSSVIFPRLDLWGAMGACTYSSYPSSISLLGGITNKSFSITTNQTYCPVAISTTAPWLQNLAIAQDAIDKKLWRVTYSTACNAPVCGGAGGIRTATFDLAIAASTVPVSIAVTQSGNLGTQTITPSAGSLDFGSYEQTGIPSPPLTVSLRNSGTQDPLTISAISTVQNDLTSTCPDFIATSSCTGQDIAPQTSCAVAVAFNPQFANVRQCKLRIASNDPVNAITFVPLTGFSTSVNGGRLDTNFSSTAAGFDTVTTFTGDRLLDVLALPDEYVLAAGYSSGLQVLLTKYKGRSDLGTVEFSRAVQSIASPRTSQARLVRRDSQGRILAFGTATNGTDKKAFIARFTAGGVLDTSFGMTFGTPGYVLGSFGTETVGQTDDHLQYAAVGSDDRLYLKVNCKIVRLDAAGNRDMSYGGIGYASTHDCIDTAPFVVLPGGEVIYATSSVDAITLDQGIGVSKLTSAGIADSLFGKNGTSNGRTTPGTKKGYASDLAVLADGRILAVGPLWKDYAGFPNSFSAHAVRFTPDGQIDVTFGNLDDSELSPDTAPVYPGVLRAFGSGQFAVLRSAPPPPIGNASPGSFDVLLRKADGKADGSFRTPNLIEPGKVTSTLGDGTAMSLAPDGGVLVAFTNTGANVSGLARFTPPQLSGSSAEGLGSRVVGSESDAAFNSVTFTNTTSSTITGFTSFVVSNSDFQILGNNCGTTLTAGGTCTINFSVTRNVVGPRATTLTVTTMQGTTPVIFLLSLQVTVRSQSAFPFTVAKSGSGAGRVVSVPYGIDCGNFCQVTVVGDALPANQMVTLNATPNQGSDFVGWSGDCTGTGACVVTVSAARNVMAAFNIKPVNVPVNDNFAARRVLTGSLVQDRISNLGASKEASEANHAGNAGGKSLWWTWTAPFGGRVTIDTAGLSSALATTLQVDTKGSTFDTLLAVYTGSTLASLLPVGQSDDAAFFASSVTFVATKGQTYQIAVDGYNGATGDVVLNIYQPIYAFVSVQTGGDAYVIDTVTKTRLPNITTFETNQNSIAISGQGDRAYISNYLNASISVIDTDTRTIVPPSPAPPTKPVGANPDHIAVNPIGNRVYVTSAGANAVLVLDRNGDIAKDGSGVNIPAIPVGSNPVGIAINPAGTRAYVAHNGTNTIGVIDLATNKMIATLMVGNRPTEIAFNSAGTRAYVVNSNYPPAGGIGNVTVIDTSNNTTIATIDNVGKYPYGIALNPAGTRAYVTVTNEGIGNGVIKIIDTSTNQIRSCVAVGVFPEGVAVTPDGKQVYVANYTGATVMALDALAIENLNPNCGTIPPIDSIFTFPASGPPGQGAPTSIAIFGGGVAIAVPPANDNFSNRRVLSGGYAVDLADNRLATKESTEPNHAGNAGGKSVWWTWTAPVNGKVTMDTFGSNFDTLVGVYMGSSVGSLTVPASATTIDSVSAGVTTKSVSFTATSGQTYQIAVDGKNGAGGKAVLTVWQPIYAYIANNGGRFFAIDTVTNTTKPFIDGAGPYPYHDGAVAVSPSGDRVYVDNYLENTIWSIDTETKAITTIPVGSRPDNMAIDASGTRLYVLNIASNDISVIDTTKIGSANNPVIATVSVGGVPGGIALDPDPANARAYVSVSPNLVKILNTANNTFGPTPITVGSDPRGIAFDPDASKNKAYVANLVDNTVSVINTAANVPVFTITGFEQPFQISVDPAGNRAYVTGAGNSNKLFVINTTNNQNAANVTVGTLPYGNDVSPLGNRVYVPNRSSGTISVIDTSTDPVTNTVSAKLAATLTGFTQPVAFGRFIVRGGTVAKVPNAPTIQSVVAGNGQVTLTFTGPVSNGGSAITSYTVTAFPGGITANCLAPCTSITITGLTNGTAYSFTITATNGIGTGVASATSPSIIPGTNTSTTTLASSLVPSRAGQSVTLTATVTASGTPSGSVVFRDGGNVIAGCGTVPLSNGVAQCITTSLPPGARAITAQYSGNGTYNASVSGIFIQTVIPSSLEAIIYFLLS